MMRLASQNGGEKLSESEIEQRSMEMIKNWVN